MKKILSYLLLAAILPFLAGCETDIDSNPTLAKPESFVLNVPPYAANNIYDMKASSAVELTCSQPDYGYPAYTNYCVQVTLDESFTEANEEAGTVANYTTLPTIYTGTKLNVVSSELNEAALTLYQEKNPDADVPTDPIAVTLRLKANINNGVNDTLGVCYSNAVTLPKVRLSQPQITVTVPSTMYVNGDLAACGGDWSKFFKLAGVSTTPGMFYGVVYCQEGAQFKLCKDNFWGSDKGFGQITVTDNAKEVAGLKSADEASAGANIVASKAGWYTIVVTTKVVGKEVQYTLDMQPAEVYLFGVANGAIWEFNDAWKFTTPADASGDFVSPAAVAAGEARISVKVAGTDWWKTELTLQGGSTIFFREENNIVNSWEENVGSDYSVKLAPGSIIHLNFTQGTGSVE